MKKVICCLLFGALACLVSANEALAVKDFQDGFYAKYNVAEPKTDAEKSLAAAVKEVKCNLCHAGKSKKMRNAYGMALDELLDRKEISAIKKEDKEKAMKMIAEAIEKVAKAKNGDDVTFGSLIEAGKLPGGEG